MAEAANITFDINCLTMLSFPEKKKLAKIHQEWLMGKTQIEIQGARVKL